MARLEKCRFAKQLRHNQTPAEEQLWAKVRAKRLNGFKFKRQVPLGIYVVDFLCEAQKLIIEVDGESHVDRVDYDKQRTAYFDSCGYQVLRFWNADIYEHLEGVLDTIVLTLENAKP